MSNDMATSDLAELVKRTREQREAEAARRELEEANAEAVAEAAEAAKPRKRLNLVFGKQPAPEDADHGAIKAQVQATRVSPPTRSPRSPPKHACVCGASFPAMPELLEHHRRCQEAKRAFFARDPLAPAAPREVPLEEAELEEHDDEDEQPEVAGATDEDDDQDEDADEEGAVTDDEDDQDDEGATAFEEAPETEAEESPAEFACPDCGGTFRSEAGVRAHRARYCPKRATSSPRRTSTPAPKVAPSLLELVPCPEGCGREVKKIGLASHRRKCKAARSAGGTSSTSPPPQPAARTTTASVSAQTGTDPLAALGVLSTALGALPQKARRPAIEFLAAMLEGESK